MGESSRNGRARVSYNLTPDAEYSLLQLILYVLSFVTVLLIFKKLRIAAITGIVVAIEYVSLAPGDKAQFFFVGVSVSVGITIIERVALIASIVVLSFAPMVYLANRKSLKPSQ